MLTYTIRRLSYMLIVLTMVSVVSFLVIQLPPGDFLSMHIMQLQEQGNDATEAEIASLRKAYGLDLPMYAQYLRWITGVLRGNFGRSFQWNMPVRDLIGERLALTITISIITLLLTYIIAIPVGIYSATHQYSVADYAFTTFGFVGMAIPGFMLALILMYISFRFFGLNVGGLFSAQYMRAEWSMAKVLDLLRHLPVPVLVIGIGGTAGLIRVMRGCLLDELQKQYVITARTKGLAEPRILFRYPVRIAINPMVSTVGWLLPAIVSGGTIVALVLDLPTVGPLMFGALLSQDMYLSSTILMLLSSLTVVGTFISDLLLAVLDPRIRLD